MRFTGSSDQRHAHPAGLVESDRIPRGVVVSYTRSAQDLRSHESVTRKLIAERLAALQGYEYAGDYDECSTYTAPVYFVPDDTLSLDIAHALGIRGETDLFGGVVPFPFIATKSITHPLSDPGATAPTGWSAEFSQLVRGSVLTGYAAFAREDARRAGGRLLQNGPVRVKPALEVGGRGQIVAADADALDRSLEELDRQDLAQCGVVVEQNLTDVMTYSVGQVQVGGLLATYVGTQKLAKDHHDREVYGGSALIVARGDFDALLQLHIDDSARHAIEQARIYDDAARRCFPGFFASRRNYDMVRGVDGTGAVCTGVLEQSWRVGGASGAEIAALEAFRSDTQLHAVHAECTESYDDRQTPPAGATVYFRGTDPCVGFILKYTTVASYVDA